MGELETGGRLVVGEQESLSATRSYVTTSWDDGNEADLRIAGMLAERGLAGSFYWTTGGNGHRGGEASRAVAREMLDMGMEIGSHTVTHPILTRIDSEAAEFELTESKNYLEDLTDGEVISFCYPKGAFNNRIRNAVVGAGYSLARTTLGFHDSLEFDPFLMPVTAQVYPHGRRSHVTHPIKRRSRGGLANWLSGYGAATDLEAIVTRALANVEANGGIVHLWGHVWELDAMDLWPQLEVLLDLVAHRPAMKYVTNGALASPD